MPYKLLSLLIALLFWYVVQGEEVLEIRSFDSMDKIG